MKKMSLLEMTQNILSAMDSDEVNSINDTIESQQVAEVIKETYMELFSNQDIQEWRRLLTVSDAGILLSPNYLELQDEVVYLDWFKYKDVRNSNEFKEVEFLQPRDFFDLVFSRSSTLDNAIPTIDIESGVTYYILNDTAPTYYTLLQQKYLVTDSVDKLYEDTLHEYNTAAYGQVAPVWTASDAFIPDLDSKKFPLLLSEAKSTCFINFKQISSTKEEQRSRRQRVRGVNDRRRSLVGNKYYGSKNFARRTR